MLGYNPRPGKETTESPGSGRLPWLAPPIRERHVFMTAGDVA